MRTSGAGTLPLGAPPRDREFRLEVKLDRVEYYGHWTTSYSDFGSCSIFLLTCGLYGSLSIQSRWERDRTCKLTFYERMLARRAAAAYSSGRTRVLEGIRKFIWFSLGMYVCTHVLYTLYTRCITRYRFVPRGNSKFLLNIQYQYLRLWSPAWSKG